MWIGELITERGIGNGISFIIFAGIVSRAPSAISAFIAQPEHRDLRRLRRRRGRRGRRDHLHPGRPAPDPDPVRQPRPRPADVLGRSDVPAAAGQPGRRDPDHLRGQHPALPEPAGVVLHDVGDPDRGKTSPTAIVDDLQPDSRSSTSSMYFLLTDGLHVLLHGVHVQAGRDRRAAAQERRVHPGHPAGPARPRTTSPASSPGSPSPARCSWRSSPCRRRSWRSLFRDLGTLGLGGTSLLIVVSVVVETMKQIEAQLMMRNYEGFIR